MANDYLIKTEEFSIYVLPDHQGNINIGYTDRRGYADINGISVDDARRLANALMTAAKNAEQIKAGNIRGPALEELLHPQAGDAHRR